MDFHSPVNVTGPETGWSMAPHARAKNPQRAAPTPSRPKEPIRDLVLGQRHGFNTRTLARGSCQR
jgi:hypothetical protein